MDIRKLTKEEVTFSIEMEHEELPVRGNVMASDDADFDKQCEDEILARLKRDDMTAWFIIVVKATFEFDGEEYTGIDTLGGNSLSDECEYAPGDKVNQEIEEIADEHGMKSEALENLNANIAEACERSQKLIEHLKP